MSVVKTYYLIDKVNSTEVESGVYENDFPIEFADARGNKWIEVRYCFAIFDKYLVSDIVLHSDFIKRDAYLDSAVSVINSINNGGHPDKYLYPEGAPKRFRIWFTDLNGERLVPDKFQMKMLLVSGYLRALVKPLRVIKITIHF